MPKAIQSCNFTSKVGNYQNLINLLYDNSKIGYEPWISSNLGKGWRERNKIWILCFALSYNFSRNCNFPFSKMGQKAIIIKYVVLNLNIMCWIYTGYQGRILLKWKMQNNFYLRGCNKSVPNYCMSICQSLTIVALNASRPFCIIVWDKILKLKWLHFASVFTLPLLTKGTDQ